jgi:hypothetical protein
MKCYKYIASLVLVLVLSQAQAQSIFDYYQGLFTSEEKGTDLQDRLLLELNWNSWLETPAGIDLRPVSIGFNVYRMYDIPFKKGGAVSFAFGYGFSSHNVHNNGAFVVGTDSASGNSFTALEPFDPAYEYRKNKIAVNYVDVPLELRIRTKGARKFRLTAGFKAGVLVSDHTKTIDDDQKVKVYNLKNVMKYRYGAYGRIGFGRLIFTGYYALTPLFKKGRGEQLFPISAGIVFILY